MVENAEFTRHTTCIFDNAHLGARDDRAVAGQLAVCNTHFGEMRRSSDQAATAVSNIHRRSQLMATLLRELRMLTDEAVTDCRGYATSVDSYLASSRTVVEHVGRAEYYNSRTTFSVEEIGEALSLAYGTAPQAALHALDVVDQHQVAASQAASRVQGALAVVRDWRPSDPRDVFSGDIVGSLQGFTTALTAVERHLGKLAQATTPSVAEQAGGCLYFGDNTAVEEELSFLAGRPVEDTPTAHFAAVVSSIQSFVPRG